MGSWAVGTRAMDGISLEYSRPLANEGNQYFAYKSKFLTQTGGLCEAD
jgi:hypothetical protein